MRPARHVRGCKGIRVDEDTARELQALAQQAGSRNAAVVAAIHETYRGQVLDALRAEAAALAEDPDYQADVRAARMEMGAGDAW